MNITLTLTIPDDKKDEALLYILPEIENYLLDRSIEYSGMTTKQKYNTWLAESTKEMYIAGKKKQRVIQTSEQLKTSIDLDKTFSTSFTAQ